MFFRNGQKDANTTKSKIKIPPQTSLSSHASHCWSLSTINATTTMTTTTPSSTVPTSCIQTESTVLAVPAEKAWKSFRELKLDTLAPEYVKTVSGVTAGTVGSTVDITYQDGAQWQVCITELSDRNYTIVYDVISTEPSMTCTSVEGQIELQSITESNQTFMKWTTIFSNDADAQVMADQKYKKLDFFKAFHKNLT
jgi:hypothetical protein